MNKAQKEMIDSCVKVEYDDENIPLLDTIYIMPTTKKHDSGYKIMYVAGYSKETDTCYLLDTICDVIDIGDLVHNEKIRSLHIDIKENGIIQLWSRYQRFKSIFKLSSCTFEMVDKR